MDEYYQGGNKNILICSENFIPAFKKWAWNPCDAWFTVIGNQPQLWLRINQPV
jgi:hypothetical protein